MKVVYDTCIYIEFLRTGKHQELLSDPTHIRFLSPIVILELRAGALYKQQLKQLDKLFKPYYQNKRIIDISHTHYLYAGECLARLRNSKFPKHLSHDILIALSARSIGATLFTVNKKDFQMIEKKIKYKVEYL